MAYYKRLGAEDGVCVRCGYNARYYGKRLQGGFCKPCAKDTKQFKARMAAASMRRAQEALADMAQFPGE